MPRVTNDREQCPERDEGEFHLWVVEGQRALVCHYCGAERWSLWVEKESDADRKEKES